MKKTYVEDLQLIHDEAQKLATEIDGYVQRTTERCDCGKVPGLRIFNKNMIDVAIFIECETCMNKYE